jgi:hypothetical protein
VLLAGLISERQNNSRSGIPLIDQLGEFGKLFGNTTKASQRTELIIFIRPQIIRDSVDAGVPVLGHCLGGQLMARALGGAVTRNPVKEIGWGEVKVADNAVAREWFGALEAFDSFHWHGETFSIPPGGTTRITIPPGAMISTNDYVENKGVFIQSDKPVTIFAVGRRDLISQTDPAFPQNDIFQPELADSLVAYLVHPTSNLGTSYRVVAPGTFQGSGFTIVAANDNTSVTIDLVVSFGSRTSAAPWRPTTAVRPERGWTWTSTFTWPSRTL